MAAENELPDLIVEDDEYEDDLELERSSRGGYYIEPDFSKIKPLIDLMLKNADKLGDTLKDRGYSYKYYSEQMIKDRQDAYRSIKQAWLSLATIIPRISQGYQGATKQQREAYKIINHALTWSTREMNPYSEFECRHLYVTIRDFGSLLKYGLDDIIADRSMRSGKIEYNLEIEWLRSGQSSFDGGVSSSMNNYLQPETSNFNRKPDKRGFFKRKPKDKLHNPFEE